MRKILLRLVIPTLLGIICYLSFGFFIIQPIGAVPEGATIFYFRIGLNTPFITSADGFILDNDQSVSILSRAIVLGTLSEKIRPRKIMTLPYSHSLYKISTGGVEFEK